MIYALIVVCALAALLQWRVLHLPHIVESDRLANLRRMRIAAHIIASGYGVYLLVAGYWLQVPLALAIVVLALVDALSALWRLRPDLFDDAHNGVAQPPRIRGGADANR